MRCVAALVVWAAIPCLAVQPHDTTLFVVKLSGDSTSLFYCNRDLPTREVLSGPALMGTGKFLFSSSRGYAIYDRTGAPVDSYSVAEEEPDKKGGGPLKFVSVLDTESVLYCRTIPPTDGRKLAIYQKRLLKKRMKEVKDDVFAQYARLVDGALVNIARNTITDEMARRIYFAPQLIGFTGLGEKDERWWSVDRFYAFSSPLIDERDSALVSFFPGIGCGEREFRDKAVDAIGTYVHDGRRYYVGVSAPMGGSSWKSWQTIYFCDNAGNVLYTDSIPKQANTEVVLGRDSDARKNMIYTARATSAFVFPPVVDTDGRLFYGMVDYAKNTITVHERIYPVYAAQPCEADLAHLIDLEKDISYEPVSIACNHTQATGAMIPRVRFIDAKGARRAATVRDLTRGDFIARITREVYRDIESKLAHGRGGLPAKIGAICDSLSTAINAACPYSLSLSGPRGVNATFNYGAGEEVLCARVLAVRSTGDVLVRVDLQDWAEILVFSSAGAFQNRFIFNRQPCTQRNDVVVASDRSPIIEVDYESDAVKGSFRSWDAQYPRW